MIIDTSISTVGAVSIHLKTEHLENYVVPHDLITCIPFAPSPQPMSVLSCVKQSVLTTHLNIRVSPVNVMVVT